MAVCTVTRLLIVVFITQCCGVHREVEVIQPLTESFWDPEKYCLTYDKDGTIYELYDEQQILYPVVVVCSGGDRQGTNPVRELCGAPLL